MNNCFRRDRIRLKLLFAAFLVCLFSYGQSDDILTIRYEKGNSLSYKPSFPQRLSGVRQIVIPIPSDMAQTDREIFGAFNSYFRSLGLKVFTIKAQYERNSLSYGRAIGVVHQFKEGIKNEEPPVGTNALFGVLDWWATFGSWSNETYVNIHFYDKDYSWDYSFELPSSVNNYIQSFKNEICNKWQFDSRFELRPSYYYCPNWNASRHKQQILENGCDNIEGVYSGDDYTLGVKKHTDGKYYVICYESNEILKDWKSGDVKAILTPTATQYLFTSDWYDGRKIAHKGRVSFIDGSMVVENNDINATYNFIKVFPDIETIRRIESENSVSSGTGFLITKDGFIVTNAHVVEKAKSIRITGINENYDVSFEAEIEVKDSRNDLAILKINDPSFRPVSIVPYTLKTTVSSVGEDCFVLGYPLINTMGLDIKLTNGIISSKTGFQGDISEYQISAPVQPGNSGGPLFDKNGNVIGVVCAKHLGAENVGYAIKASYIQNLIDSLEDKIILPQNNILKGKPLPKQVELAEKAVCVIIINGDIK